MTFAIRRFLLLCLFVILFFYHLLIYFLFQLEYFNISSKDSYEF